jgi:hypothetical protein
MQMFVWTLDYTLLNIAVKAVDFCMFYDYVYYNDILLSVSLITSAPHFEM